MVSVRRMAPDDMPAARALLALLGYPMDVEEVRRRYDAVAMARDHILMVAEQDGSVISLCHTYARPALDKPPEAVVQALVVDPTLRAHGVGKMMMAAAEAWAADRGYTSVILGSNVARSDAHAFYEALGYALEATSHLFRKTIKLSLGIA